MDFVAKRPSPANKKRPSCVLDGRLLRQPRIGTTLCSLGLLSIRGQAPTEALLRRADLNPDVERLHEPAAGFASRRAGSICLLTDRDFKKRPAAEGVALLGA